MTSFYYCLNVTIYPPFTLKYILRNEPHPSQVQIGLLAVSPEQDGGARVGSGDGFTIHQQSDQDNRD